METSPRRAAGDAWHELLETSFAGLSAVARGEPARGSLAAARAGEVGIFAVTGSTQQVRRTTSAARRQPLDLIKVCVQLQGRARVEQGRRTVDIAPGQLALYDTSSPYQLDLLGPWRCAVMTVPRSALGFPSRSLDALFSRPHASSAGTGRLLASLLVDYLAGSPQEHTAASVGEAAVALLSGTLMAAPSGLEPCGPDRVRRAVREHVRAHARDPGLTPAAVASAHHMSLRNLQRLFENEEQSVAALIREQRLATVRKELADPAFARHSIGALAARAGILDQAWLSRRFRGSFGVTPSQYRREALGRA